MIGQHFTIFDKTPETLPFIVFNSIEKKDDQYKSDSQHYNFWKKRDTLPILVYNSLERKDDLCKSYFTLFEKMYHTWPFLVFN